MSTEVRIVDPKTGGAKGQKPERFDLLPWDALQEVARVYHAGAMKYDDNNWLRGFKWSLSFGALLRHLSLWWLGEEYDDGPGGTGCRHLACVGFHVLALLTFSIRGLGTDDRVLPPRRATPPPASVDTSAPTEAGELAPDEPIPFVVVPLPPLVPVDLDVPITTDPDTIEPFPYREDGSEAELFGPRDDEPSTLSGIGASVGLNEVAEELARRG